MVSSLAKKSGLSLIEVIITIFVFTVAILTTLGFFNLMLKFSQERRYITVASQAAQAQIDYLRDQGFSALVVNTAPAPVSVPDLPSGQMKTYVKAYQSSPTTSLLEIVVKVYWSGRGESRAIELSTLMSNGGVGR